MKRARIIIADICLFITVVLTALSVIAAYIFISVYIASHHPDLWAFLNANSWEKGKEMFIGFATYIIAAVIMLGVGFVCYHLLIMAFNRVLQCNITRPTDRYPTEYYISKHGFTDDDRRTSAQLCFDVYRRSYTAIIEFTFEEMTEILCQMELCGNQDYILPKSFLMPDHVSWLHPIIPLCTARRVMKELKDGGAVLLKYRCAHPKGDGIQRTIAKVRIKANLHCPTYTSKDVFVGYDSQ